MIFISIGTSSDFYFAHFGILFNPGKYCQSYFKEILQINRIKTSVKRHSLNVRKHPNHFGSCAFNVYCSVHNILTARSQVHAYIFQAVFIPATVIYLISMYTHCFTEICITRIFSFSSAVITAISVTISHLLSFLSMFLGFSLGIEYETHRKVLLLPIILN